MSSVDRGKRLYKKFHDEPVGSIDKIVIPDHDTIVSIGECLHVAYRVNGESYIHRFRARSRPLLAVSVDGQQLYLIGGNYEFTERGIEDR